MYKSAKQIIRAIYSAFYNAKKSIQQPKQGEGEKLISAEAPTASINTTKNPNITNPSRQQLRELTAYYETGRLREAEKLASSITQIFPENQFAWKILGLIFQQTDRPSDSLVASQRSVQLAPQDVEAKLNLGAILNTLGKVYEAKACFEQAISLNPGFALAHYNLAVTLRRLGRLDDAEGSYRKVIALRPDDTEAYARLGNLLEELDRYEEAEASFRQAIFLKPGNAVANATLGVMLHKLGRLEEAEACYKLAIASKSDYVVAHVNLGILFKRQGKMEEAEACYKLAIAIKPDYSIAYGNLAGVLTSLGKLKEAGASYTQAVKLNPKDAKAQLGLGKMHMRMGRLDDAEACFKQTISIDPELAEAYSNLAVTLQELGRLDEAESNYNKAKALKPDFVTVHYNLAGMLKGVGRFGEAEASYRKAVALKPDFPEAHNNLLRCLFLQDKKSLFIDQLDYLIDQNITNAVIGSFTCRSASKFGLEKPNLFCKDPLKHVSHIDLNTQYDFEEIFVKETRSVLDDNRLSNRNQTLLVNGYQTAGNLFEIESGLINKIEEAIRLEIEKYRINFKNSQEGLIKKWPTEYLLYGWLISMKSGGELRPHIHDDGWISGSAYINVPANLKANSGNLVVSLDGIKGTADKCIHTEKIINVATGSLVLFPASLMHYTIPFEAQEERIVLAFDVIRK